jgi:phenylalanyl-tRNA synthetase beta chain
MELAGGKITSEILDNYPNKVEAKQLIIQFDYINKLVGQEIPRGEIKSILTSLDIKINNVSETTLGLSIPSYRVDVTRPADVVEEILRVYGYNNIDFSDALSTSMPDGSKPLDHLERRVSNQLVNLGFFEIYNNSIAKPAKKEKEGVVTLVNPLSQELSAMRTSLYGGLTEVISYNINRRTTNCKLFEFGNVYHKSSEEYHQNHQLILGVVGNQNESHWRGTENKSDFFYLKGVIEAICRREGVEYTENLLPESEQLIDGISLESNQNQFATIGQLDSGAFENIDEETVVFVAEIDWEKFTTLAKDKKIKVRPISKFPSVKRDMALLIDSNIAFESLRKVALETEKKLLTSIQLFDVYEGKGIPEGKKSYGLSFTLSDHAKTLTDKQVDKVMSKIQHRIQNDFGAELR